MDSRARRCQRGPCDGVEAGVTGPTIASAGTALTDKLSIWIRSRSAAALSIQEIAEPEVLGAAFRLLAVQFGPSSGLMGGGPRMRLRLPASRSGKPARQRQ